MEITIKPEEIDQYVRDAILKSTFGEIFQNTMKDLFKPRYNGDGPVEDAMKGLVRKMAIEIVETKYKAEITAEITRVMNEKFTPDFITKLSEATITRALDKM